MCNFENFQNVWFQLVDFLLRTYFFIRNITINIEIVKKKGKYWKIMYKFSSCWESTGLNLTWKGKRAISRWGVHRPCTETVNIGKRSVFQCLTASYCDFSEWWWSTLWERCGTKRQSPVSVMSHHKCVVLIANLNNTTYK